MNRIKYCSFISATKPACTAGSCVYESKIFEPNFGLNYGTDCTYVFFLVLNLIGYIYVVLVHKRIYPRFVINKAGSDHDSFRNQEDAKITLINSSKRSGYISVLGLKYSFFETTTIFSFFFSTKRGPVIMRRLMTRGIIT